MDLKFQTNAVKLLSRIIDPNRPTQACIKYSSQKKFIKNAQILQPFERTPPEKTGISSSRIYNFIKELIDDPTLDLHNIIILAGGKVIFEGSFGAYRADIPHAVYSQSKSVTSIAIGMLVDDRILSLDEKIVKIFEKKCSPLTMLSHKNITVENLLTMTSGAVFNEVGAVTEEDWLKGFLETSIRGEAGKTFNYNSMNTYVLSEIVREKTGKSLTAFLDERLFKPLGICDYYWEKSPSGVEKGGWGLYLTPEDMAKIGQLYLNKGMWSGKRIVSEEWIKNSTKMETASPEKLGPYNYGYQIWVGREEDSFLFNGFFGQNLMVYPQNDIIISANAAICEMFQQSSYYKLASKYFGGEFKRFGKEKNSLSYKIKLKKLSKNMDRAKGGFFFKKYFVLREQKKLIDKIIGGSYTFRSPSPVGLMPLLSQIIQNNYTTGISRISFGRDEKSCYLNITESQRTQRLDFDVGRVLYSDIYFGGEKYEIASETKLMYNEDDRILLKLHLSFTEDAPSRKLVFVFHQDSVILRLNESPGREFIVEGIEYFAEDTMNKRIVGILTAMLETDRIKHIARQITEPEIIGIKEKISK